MTTVGGSDVGVGELVSPLRRAGICVLQQQQQLWGGGRRSGDHRFTARRKSYREETRQGNAEERTGSWTWTWTWMWMVALSSEGG